MDMLSKHTVVRGLALLALLALLAGTALPQRRQTLGAGFGGLYEEAGSSIITVVTGGTYYQWVSSTVGPERKGVVASAVTDNLTVEPGYGGVYLVCFDVSYAGSAAEKVHWHAFRNGNLIPNVGAEALAVVKAEGAAASHGLVELSAGDIVDLRVTAVTNGTTVTVLHASLVIVKID